MKWHFFGNTYQVDYYKNNKFKYLNNDFFIKKNISIYETSKQIAQIKTCVGIVEGIKKMTQNLEQQ